MTFQEAVGMWRVGGLTLPQLLSVFDGPRPLPEPAVQEGEYEDGHWRAPAPVGVGARVAECARCKRYTAMHTGRLCGPCRWQTAHGQALTQLGTSVLDY